MLVADFFPYETKEMSLLEMLCDQLAETSEPSIQRVNILSDYFFNMVNVDMDKAKDAVQEAYNISQALNYETGLIYYIRNLGIISYFEQRMTGAEKYLEQALADFQKMDEKRGAGKCFFFLGLIFWAKGSRDIAFEYMFNALKLGQESQNDHGEAWALTMLAGFYYDLADYRQALTHFEKGYALFANARNEEGMSRAINGVGNSWYKLGEPEKALKYQQKGLDIFRGSYVNRQAESKILNDIAGIYRALDRKKDAMKYYQRALKTRRMINYTTGLVTSLLDYGEFLLELSQYKRSKAAFEEAARLGETINARPKISRAYQGLSRVYAATGNFEAALYEYQKFHAIEEGVCSQKASSKMAYLQMVHERDLSQKETEIYRLKNVELKKKNAQLENLLKELKNTQEQLIHSEKMASLGTMMAGIAHEIKNPLNFVNNFSDLAVESTEELQQLIRDNTTALPEQFQEECGEILEGLSVMSEKISVHGKRADGIIKNMLMHSRRQSPGPEATNIAALMEQSIQLAGQTLSARKPGFSLKIEKHFAENLPQPKIIAQDISRVFLNLVGNACDALYDKSLAAPKSFVPKIDICISATDAQLEIRVRDNGDGIPAHIRDHIFTPFFTTKPAGKGTGLGLSIAYDIIKNGHRGKLNFRTETGEFTEFIIVLPL